MQERVWDLNNSVVYKKIISYYCRIIFWMLSLLRQLEHIEHFIQFVVPKPYHYYFKSIWSETKLTPRCHLVQSSRETFIHQRVILSLIQLPTTKELNEPHGSSRSLQLGRIIKNTPIHYPFPCWPVSSGEKK